MIVGHHHRRQKAGLSPATAYVIGGLMVLGGFWALWSWWAQGARITAACAWPTAPGVVRQTSVETGRSGGGRRRSSHPIYIPHISYTFTVGQQMCAGQTLRFSSWAYRSLDDANAMIARHREGSALTVHYDPQRPVDNVLWPELSDRNGALGVIAGVLICFGAVLIVAHLPRFQGASRPASHR